MAPMSGRNSLAAPRATSRPSIALHGLYFCVLALSAIFTAISRSTGSSTYTWQLPSRCLMTGTFVSRLMRSIRLLPPRGMITSTYCGMAIRWPTASRSVVCTSCTASGGSPASVKACCTSRASALLESIASDPPRRMHALPLLIDRLAASMVTLGRLSKIIANTPIGTRIWPTRMPLGCCFIPMISPMMSGMAASCSQPWATVSMILGVSLRRSSMGAGRPLAAARSMSFAFSCPSACTLARSSLASASSAPFLVAAPARAIRAEACLACKPSVCVYSATFSAFMVLIIPSPSGGGLGWGHGRPHAPAPPSPEGGGRRRTLAAQRECQPVQRLPAVGGPVRHLQALDDPIDQVSRMQQVVQRSDSEPRQHALEQPLFQAPDALLAQRHRQGPASRHRILHALERTNVLGQRVMHQDPGHTFRLETFQHALH